MTFGNIVTTFVGAFIFPFLISMLWGKMVDSWKAAGGWMAAAFIVGTTWALNHGVGLIYQTGAWVDMAWAAGFGLFFGSAFAGASLKKGVPSFVSAIIGGVIGAFVLSFL